MARTTMSRPNAGRVAQYEGAKFEDYIENLPCPPGVWLHRTPGRTKAVRGAGGRWVLVPDSEGRGLPDFHGAVNGRAFVFDAKRCETGRWVVSGLTAEQREHLWRVHRAGSVAGVWLRFCEGENVAGDVWVGIDRVPETGSMTWLQAVDIGTELASGAWWTVMEPPF